MAAGRGPRTPRRRTALIALVLAAAPVLAACGGSEGTAGTAAIADQAVSAALSTGADCLAPQVLSALGFAGIRPPGATRHPDAPEAGPLPDSFVPVSAVLCSTGETLTDSAGRWAAITASRLEGDVDLLVDALTGTTPGGGATTTACATGERRSDLWLVDALGAAVRVALPDGGCGEIDPAVRAGLDELDAVDVERYPVALVAPGASPTSPSSPTSPTSPTS
jgi:hypothetical protein